MKIERVCIWSSEDTKWFRTPEYNASRGEHSEIKDCYFKFDETPWNVQNLQGSHEDHQIK